MPLVIKKVVATSPTDLRQLFGALAEEVSRDFSGVGALLLLAVDEDGGKATIVGTAGLRRLSDGCAEIRRFIVSLQHQRQGIGKILFGKLLYEAVLAGYGKVRTQIPETAVKLHQFYAEAGFREIPPYDPAMKMPCRAYELTLDPQRLTSGGGTTDGP